MATTDDLHHLRWVLLYPATHVGQFVRGNAIPDYFVANPSIGSPIGPEQDWEGVEGGRIQAFSSAVVCWSPGDGARVVTD